MAVEMMSEMLENVDFQEFGISSQRYLESGTVMKEEEVEEIRKKDAVLFGAIGDPRVRPGIMERGVILNLRATLDLFANVRPVRSFVTGRELVVFRENTQEFYVGIGGGDRSGIERPLGLYGCEGTIGVRLSVRGGNMAFDIGIMSEAHLRRFFSRLSIYRGGRKITVTDKANAVPNMYSLWRSVAAEVLQRDGFEFTFQYADSVAYDMARNPEKYEVIVAPNLYGGDILSDLAAGLFHGLGFAPSANIGDRSQAFSNLCMAPHQT